MLISKIEWA